MTGADSLNFILIYKEALNSLKTNSFEMLLCVLLETKSGP